MVRSIQPAKVCNQPGCDSKMYSKGLCSKHYGRNRVLGDPRGVITQCSACGHVFWSLHRARLFCGLECERSARVYSNRSRAENTPKQYQEYHAAYRAANRETLRLNATVYNTKKRVVHRASSEAYRKLHPNYSQEYRARRPDVVLRRTARHRLKKKGLPVDVKRVSARYLFKMLSRYHWECAYCSVSLPEGFHWDHVVPLSRGGTHSEGNLLPVCPPCNLSKSGNLLTEWRKRRPVVWGAT